MGLFHNQWSSKKFEYIMFRDFCILLYELKSRPIDIVTMKWSSIEYNERYGGYVCSYVPTKKKNTTNRNKAKSVQFISSKAMEIMQKYKGQSKYGYILPFEINNTREWDLNDVEQFHEHSKMWKVLQNMMGRFLERVGKKLGLPFKLTLYAFRRTAITHEIINNEMPINMIAKVAGTSTRMIESHYTNYLDALSHFRTQEQLDMAAEDVDKNNNKNPRKPKKSKRG
jgi:integrase